MTNQSRHQLVRGATCTSILLVLTLVTAACGLPGDSATRTIARENVPYRLLDPSPSASPSPPMRTPSVTTPQVFFVNRDEKLVPQAQPVSVSGLVPVVEALLAALSAGPSQLQRQRGLATALGPNVTLDLLEVRDGTARVEITPADRTPDAGRLPLAVGQVVLSATSVEGVDSVVLVYDGEPLELPLPGGERTSEPVTAQDYATLREDPSAPIRKAKPEGDQRRKALGGSLS